MSEQSDRSRANETSTVVGHLRTVTTLFGLWVSHATLARLARKAQHIGASATQTSALARVGRVVLAWVQCSFLYRWLTAEPDPQVIVIDLRETITVGPFVRMADWVVHRTRETGRHSMLSRGVRETVAAVRRAPFHVAGLGVGTAVIANAVLLALAGAVGVLDIALHGVLLIGCMAATQLRVPLADLADARTVQLLVAVFEPPEPPEDFDLTRRRQE